MMGMAGGAGIGAAGHPAEPESTGGPAGQELVLIIDFGAQYSQLIARRVREHRVYCELVHHTVPLEEILRRRPRAVILSGGPASVYGRGAPRYDRALFEAGVPVLGICYGMQLMTYLLGGDVRRGDRREYGRTTLTVLDDADLLAGVERETQCWMSHGDLVVAPPPGFSVLARTENTPGPTPRAGATLWATSSSASPVSGGCGRPRRWWRPG